MPEWKYLTCEVFQVRQVIAAHFLADCTRIVEIGGYKTPIDGFLKHDYRSVVVVDPLTEPFESDRVRRVACDYRDFDFSFLEDREYGLALLGFDLPLSDKLFRLADRAKTVVIEFPEDSTWKQSRESFDALLSGTALSLAVKIHLDLSGNDYGDLTDSWPPRTDRFIYVLRSPARPRP